jgi:hypothetical protein
VPDSTAAQNTVPTAIWWVPLIAALIGALSALATTFLKDFLIQRWNETRLKSMQQRDIFRNYAAPLAGACQRLCWRFAEIFIEERHQFLKTATLPLVYNEYKRRSTLYRIASLIGWIRALDLELDALPRGASGFLTPVSKAISEVQSALADGPDVETFRLEQMCAIWGIDIQSLDEKGRKSLATRLEIRLYESAGDSLKHDSNHLKNLEGDKKLEVCFGLCDFLCKELKRAPLPKEIVRETLHQAIAGLSYREALIYRDWQQAIGDAMLEVDKDSVRRFKVIGFEQFEKVLAGDSLWMEVFRDSIVDIDFEAVDPNDYRAKQLKSLASGVANVLLSLASTEDRDLVDPNILDIAERLAALPTTPAAK